MDPLIGGTLIGAGTSLVSGLMGKKANQEANEQANRQAEANVALQREFAQNGIRWKVEDAKAAGIHPLYALGAQGASFSPVSTGSTPDNSMALALNDMGQNVSRAVSATRTGEEKAASALNLQMAKANLDGALIDNQIKASQLRQLNSTGPSAPGSTNFMPGQGDSGVLMNVKPNERVASQPGKPAQEAGWKADRSFSRTDTGLTPMVPEGLSESLEDDIIGKLFWRVRNQLMPNLDGRTAAPDSSQLPKGANKWNWSHVDQEWQPMYADGINPPRKLRYK